MLTEQDKVKKILKTFTEDNNYTRKAAIAEDLKAIIPYPAHENRSITVEERAVMTEQVSEKLKEVFDIMKLDHLNDPNLKDTPMRVASMWINEMMIGRYQHKPRMEAFPLQYGDGGVAVDDKEIDTGMMISKKVDVRSLCSHHLAPFHDVVSDDNSYAIIAYIPTDKLLGISKLQRLINWYGARPHLQEQLTYQIYNEICETIDSKNVFVSFKNIEHTCESLRGVKSMSGRTSTMQYGGIFKNSDFRREAILQAI